MRYFAASYKGIWTIYETDPDDANSPRHICQAINETVAQIQVFILNLLRLNEVHPSARLEPPTEPS